MAESGSRKFNGILGQIIKKSLFTERQIEIILNKKKIQRYEFSISRGAYYRQVGQARDKLMRFYYTMILLHSLDVILINDIDVITKLAKSISAIKMDGSSSEIVSAMTGVSEYMDLFIKKQVNL